MAVTAAVAAAVGTAYTIYSGERAAKAQKRAAQQAQRAQDLKAARERRQQYRQARAARAEIASQSAGGGMGFGSSSFVTGRGQVGTQAGTNVSFLNQYQDITKQQGIFQSQAYTWMGRSQMGGAIANLGMQGLEMAGGFKSLFKTT